MTLPKGETGSKIAQSSRVAPTAKIDHTQVQTIRAQEMYTALKTHKYEREARAAALEDHKSFFAGLLGRADANARAVNPATGPLPGQGRRCGAPVLTRLLKKAAHMLPRPLSDRTSRGCPRIFV